MSPLDCSSYPRLRGAPVFECHGVAVRSGGHGMSRGATSGTAKGRREKSDVPPIRLETPCLVPATEEQWRRAVRALAELLLPVVEAKLQAAAEEGPR